MPRQLRRDAAVLSLHDEKRKNIGRRTAAAEEGAGSIASAALGRTKPGPSCFSSLQSGCMIPNAS
jgi:hypothetical protein